MGTNKAEIYEQQKQDLLTIAEQQFGKDYFKKLDEILTKITEINEEKTPKYKLVINHNGAFYAFEE